MIRHLLKLIWKRKGSSTLLTMEIFFSFLILFGVATLAAAMIIRYMRPLGFDYRNVWTIGVPFQETEGADMQHRQMIDAMRRELLSMPEIESVAASGTPALSTSVWEGKIEYNGRRLEVTRDDVTDDYQKVLHVKVLEGRWFRADDEDAATPPMVIDQDLAREIAPNGSALGLELNAGKKPTKIIGIIAPFRKSGELSKDHVNMAFTRATLTRAVGFVPHYLIVRVRPGVPADFEATVVQRLHAVVPDHPARIIHMEKMHETMLRLYLAPAILAGVVAAFLITMVLLGLSGVLWQNVTRRTREIGLRRALGATGAGIYRQILGEVALLATIAVFAGLLIVGQLPIIGAFRFVTPQAYGIGIAASLAAIYTLTLLGGRYPSWLAGKVQPAQALHYE